MSGVSLKVQVLCPKVGFLWLGPHTDTRMCIYIYIGGKEMLGSLSKVRPSQVLSRSEMLEFGFALKGEALQRCDIYIYIGCVLSGPQKGFSHKVSKAGVI